MLGRALVAVGVLLASGGQAVSIASTGLALRDDHRVLVASGGQAVSTVDDSGVRVELSRPATRVVSLAPSNTESLFAIGAGELIVGATRFDLYPEAARRIPRVGGFSDIDIERVLDLDPDLVLAAGVQASGIVQRLRALGVTVFVVEPRDSLEVIDRLEVLGGLVGAPAAAARVADALRRRLDRVERQVAGFARRPRVLYMLSRDIFTVAPGSFVHDLIVRAGGDNIAADASIPYPQISDEVVIARDPEVIFIGGHQSAVDPDQLRSRPGWGGVSAVRNGHVVQLEDADLASRPGPRIVDALEHMVRAMVVVVESRR